MNNRGLKNRTPFSSTLNTVLLNELKAYSLETGIPVSKILDKLIKNFLESVKK